MTARELERLFRQVLRTSVPVLGLSACGGEPGHRLTPTNNNPVKKQPGGHVLPVLECSDPEYERVKNDPNWAQSPRDIVTLRDVPYSALDPLKTPPKFPSHEECVLICADRGNQQGYFTLSTNEQVEVRVKVTVKECEIYTDSQPLQAACLETWEWGSGCFITGRRPEGFISHGAAGDVGAFLAAMASLEAASVPAFERLARELAAHGAPATLVERATLFAADEVKHTRMVAALARRYGVTPQLPVIDSLEVRALDEVRLENAVEGCVRETFGALLGHWQAEHAQDPAVRSAMRVIAADETRHAALSWEIEAWAKAQLPIAAQRRLEKARAEAVQEVSANASEPTAEAMRLLGLPTTAQSRVLASGLQQLLWA